MFVSKRNVLVIYETIFKKPKLISRKSCAISFREGKDRELIKWGINGEMIDETFRVEILLVRCMPSVLSYGFSVKQLLIHLMWLGGRMAGGIMLEIKLLTIWFDTRKGRVCKTNVRICTVEIVQGYKGIRADNPYNVKILEEWEERIWVEQLLSLKLIPNGLSNVSI